MAASNPGPICFSITLTSEPAYRTSTGPEPRAVVDGGEVDGAAAAAVVGVGGVVVGADDLLELPQAPASSEIPVTARMPSRRNLPLGMGGRWDRRAVFIVEHTSLWSRQVLTSGGPGVVSPYWVIWRVWVIWRDWVIWRYWVIWPPSTTRTEPVTQEARSVAR